MNKIYKKLTSILFVLSLIAFSHIPVSAAGNLPRLVDRADLLSDNEESALLEKLDEISERQKVDVVVAAADSLEGKTAIQYADDFYDAADLPQEPFAFGTYLAVSFGAAFVIALIATGIMKGKLKSVNSRQEADHYIKDGSMQLTKNNELFLYRHVDRREKPKDTSLDSAGGSTTHASSSGAMHGGGSGTF